MKTPKTILVVDDDAEVVSTLEGLLRENGYAVICAMEGEDSLTKARLEKPDLIILDILMPKMSGTEVAETPRNDPITKEIPIIFLTALQSKEDEIRRNHQVGPYFVFAKPFDTKELLNKIEQLTKDRVGFTLIELVMVIVILGILAITAIPKFVDLSVEAKKAAAQGGLGAMRSAVAISYAQSVTTGTAQFPSSITTSLFADSQIPKNALNNSTSVASTSAIPSGTATSTAGWWYISASGRVGAYSDGTVDTSSW